MINVREFGAKGDGATLDNEALQAALDAGESDIEIPSGTYIIDRPLVIPSHRHIRAQADARVVFAASKPLSQTDFLMTNANTEDGDVDITIEGGVWDGGFGRPNNIKSRDIYEIGSSSGSCINFISVRGLRLLNMTIMNPVGYYTRFSRIRDFEIRDIGFASDILGPNQDGVHFGGYCRDGVVENVRALTKGQTNDDLLAFNADDSIQRQENRGLACGPIENIVCRNIYAEDCHTAIRMASITSPIRHITIENLYAGVRCFAINLDALRYCASPLFIEDRAPHGVGDLSDIKISGMTAFFTESSNQDLALIDVEEHADAFELIDFSRPMDKEMHDDVPTLVARNLTHQRIVADGSEYTLTDKAQRCVIDGELRSLNLSLR